MNNLPMPSASPKVYQQQRERLLAFRDKHPVKILEVAGVRWEYTVSAPQCETLLLLHGSLRIAETAYGYIQLFEDTYRVITPTYPCVMQIDDLLAGLKAVLEAEHAPTVLVLGHSYGGIIAQAFVQRYPERVKQLVLSGTKALPALTPAERSLLASARQLLLLPEGVLLKFYRWAAAKLISVPEEEQAFWQDYLDEIFANRLHKADLQSIYLTIEDALLKYGWSIGQHSQWQGPVLIIDGEGDQVGTEQEAAQLKAFYPQARVMRVVGGGHAVALKKPHVYATAVKEFFRE